MDKSAFQLFKNNTRTNANDRIHDMSIIQYGRIIKVIDIQTVIVEAAVQVSLSKEVYTVTLLSFSSALFELNVQPKLGDKVLLLFLQRYDPRMFLQETVYNSNAAGYNMFSGIGILESVVKGFARTVTRFYEEGGQPVAETRSSAKWRSTFNSELALTFCRAVFNSKDEAVISVLFGKGRPFVEQFLSTVTREHGFWYDKDGNLIETNSAVTEKYSEYAPITKDIQGTQTYKIGTDKEGNATPAAINVEIDENADITVNSKSAFTATFNKGATLKTDSTELIEISNTVSSLGALVSELIDLTTELNDLVTNLDTVGSPGNHTTGPVAKPQLTALNGKLIAFKDKWEQVFK